MENPRWNEEVHVVMVERQEPWQVRTQLGDTALETTSYEIDSGNEASQRHCKKL